MSDLFNSGGRWSKGREGIFSIFRGELAKRGEFKNSGGAWTLDEAMLYNFKRFQQIQFIVYSEGHRN